MYLNKKKSSHQQLKRIRVKETSGAYLQKKKKIHSLTQE